MSIVQHMSTPRVLPLLIATASVALMVRVVCVGEDITALLMQGAAVASARAAEPKDLALASAAGEPEHGTATGGTGGHGDAAAEGSDATTAEDRTAEESHSPAHGDNAAAAPAPDGHGAHEASAAGAAESAPADPTARMSAEEIKVLQQLAQRRETLDDREKELGERTAILEAAEARIDDKVSELKDLRATLEDLIKAYEEQEDAKIRSLVKIYENMRAKDAARILEELEMDTMLLVADRMKERTLAPIMAKMNPARAKELTVELANQHELPDRALARSAE